MFCHAIFGIFCVVLPIGNSTAAMQNMGFGGVVTVETVGWSAFLGMGSGALNQIGVSIDPDKPSVGTPFSALTVESKDEQPPFQP